MPDAYPPINSSRPVAPVVVRLRSRSSKTSFPKFLLFLACFGLLVLFALACATVLGALDITRLLTASYPALESANWIWAA